MKKTLKVAIVPRELQAKDGDLCKLSNGSMAVYIETGNFDFAISLQVLLVDEGAWLNRADSDFGYSDSFGVVQSNRISDERLFDKIIASHPLIDGTLPISPETMKEIADCKGECVVEVEMVDPNMWKCGCGHYSHSKNLICSFCGADRNISEVYKSEIDFRVPIFTVIPNTKVEDKSLMDALVSEIAPELRGEKSSIEQKIEDAAKQCYPNGTFSPFMRDAYKVGYRQAMKDAAKWTDEDMKMCWKAGNDSGKNEQWDSKHGYHTQEFNDFLTHYKQERGIK